MNIIHNMLDTEYDQDSFCDVCPIQVKKYFDYSEKDYIIDEFIHKLDYGTRGFYLNYKNGPLSYSHVNGNSNIWLMGAGVRIPDYNNNHNILANKISYNKARVFIGLTSLRSNEDHSTMSGPSVLVNHFLKGGHVSWIGSNIDLFVEYTDKVSTQKDNLFETAPNDTIKKGHGYYQNLNFYFEKDHTFYLRSY